LFLFIYIFRIENRDKFILNLADQLYFNDKASPYSLFSLLCCQPAWR